MSVSEVYNESLIKYYPAMLCEGKEWVVKYYVRNPYTDKMERKRIKLNRIKKISERRKYARDLIVELNKKLSSGWNPCIESAAVKEFVLLVDAVNPFFEYKATPLLHFA